MSTCLHSSDREESTLEERQAQAVTETRAEFPVRAIHPVTNTAPYLKDPDKNRSSLELEEQGGGEVQNDRLKCFSSVCENDSLDVGSLGQVSSLKLQKRVCLSCQSGEQPLFKLMMNLDKENAANSLEANASGWTTTEDI